ncbi:Multicopper oxidase [Nitrosomonas cryotolerans]|uniref:Multicopper oxidase n=1 Tax=Nitrosomonas cryotolerans ATCC 49181 TaxID=1131553 RepID=A0A1N6HV03_9PROT|nr:copper oxidase [Nitrosomonas cryotolerans]SFQ14588.1 Multicopper oxidase [Nitrosomonas cryotolerans]SIO23617.1 Multicopper oxidase [Nitrosomonas cryotolerans ATCC 49181]
MKDDVTRRQVLLAGAAAAVGSLSPRLGKSETLNQSQSRENSVNDNKNKPQSANSEFSDYSRYRPSFGGPPDSDEYLGKLVPGLRKSGLEAVPFETPDLDKLPWRMVNGAKEFELRCTPVKREFLPGQYMNVWGFNNSMPGPTIEAVQGDRVRIVVHNELPEPTSLHWHGLELPVEFDGVPGLTQHLIPPGKSKIYEYDLHQTGTFFYHSHVAMQEAFGMVGFFIIHPRIAYDPPVDRDFGLIFQNFFIPPNSNTVDSMRMDWNWHTINGRSGPYTTPLVCKHGERVRIRLVNFSPMQHHPIHIHGHTFWLTGTEGGRIPTNAWIPRNTTLTGVAMAQDFEFVAFNPGDWIFHCHMVHHMMNHMVPQIGPRIRGEESISQYLDSLPNRPLAESVLEKPAFEVPGYPQKMKAMPMSQAALRKINGKRETRGMRKEWHMGVKGLMTVLRVLPDELFHRVMHSDENIVPGEIFEAIVKGKYRMHDS